MTYVVWSEREGGAKRWCRKYVWYYMEVVWHSGEMISSAKKGNELIGKAQGTTVTCYVLQSALEGMTVGVRSLPTVDSTEK
jgi:hypothetical protein